MSYDLRSRSYEFGSFWCGAEPATEIKDSLRELSNQLAMLNRQVGAHLDLKDV